MDKKKIIQELLPDLVELISNTLDQIENTKKTPTKKKTPAKKKTAVKKKQSAPRKKTTTKKVQKNQQEKKIPVREDFAGENTYVDDLTEATEFIELDKKVCRNHQKNMKPVKQVIKKKRCGFATDEKGNMVQVGGCGKEFDAYEGYGYLCDSCLTGNVNASR